MMIIFLYKCAFIIASSYYCLILFNFIMTVVADNNVLITGCLERIFLRIVCV